MQPKFFEDLQKYKIDTFGYDVSAVLAALSDEMADSFCRAAENLDDPAARALVSAVYKSYNDLRTVIGSSFRGKFQLADGAIRDLQRKILRGADE
jgi:hypothetical protein